MAKILAVHGIGQQLKGDAFIHNEWWPALLSGLHLAGGELLEEKDLICAFYGNLFRKRESLSTSTLYQPKDVENEEAKLLKILWEAAAHAEPNKISAPSEFATGESLSRWPQFVQRALNALSKSKFFANVSQGFMIGDLKQVVQYMNNPAIHEDVINVVMSRITKDTRVVIGHSLGSVVAYEALCQKPCNVRSFITLGSPLGIRNLIFDKLTPSPNGGLGAWPGEVTHWTNIADAGDVVAMQKELSLFFGDRVEDIIVYNGSDAHHGEWYLTTMEAGQAIRHGLS